MKTKVINGITYTHRTREGLPARIICTDRISEHHPIFALRLVEGEGELAAAYTANGRLDDGCDHNLDLFEGVEPETDWSKVAIDTKVYVRDRDDGVWLPRYFAGTNGTDLYGWVGGATSFSAQDERTKWTQMKLAEENT